MTWGVAFRLRQHVKGSLWVVPAIGIMAGWILSAASVLLDESVAGSGLWTYSASTATSLLSAIVGAMVALTGFVVTVVVLAVQMATGTFSPRYMRLWYRDGMLKGLPALLMGTLSFSFLAIRFVDETFVPNLTVSMAAIAVSASLLMFVVYLDRFLHRLRPVAVAAYAAEAGRRAFEDQQRETSGPTARIRATGRELPSGPPLAVVRARAAGTIQAVDVRADPP